MQCEEARGLALAGDLDAAELHVAGCEACFAWLEEQDPVVTLFKAARPGPLAAPASIAAAGLAGWNRPPVRLGPAWQLALAATLVAAGAAALGATLLPGLGGPLEAPAAVLEALAALPQKLLLANPAWLGAMLVLGSGACVLSVRWYQALPERGLRP